MLEARGNMGHSFVLPFFYESHCDELNHWNKLQKSSKDKENGMD